MLYKAKQVVSFDRSIPCTQVCKVATPRRELSDLRENSRKVVRERKRVVVNRLMRKEKNITGSHLSHKHYLVIFRVVRKTHLRVKSARL